MEQLPKRPAYFKRLVRTVTKRLRDRGYFPAADETDSTAGTTEEFLAPVMLRFDEAVRSMHRQQVYEDMEEIDDTVPEGSRALDVLADNAVNAEGGGLYSFIVTVEGARSHQRLIDDLIARTGLREKMYAVARDAAKYGDCFMQVVISDRMRVERLMYMPPQSMRRFEDERGLLRSGNTEEDCAFGQFDPATGKFLAGFYPWQIEHLRWNRSGASKYGRSQLFAARPAWKKWDAMNEALVINWLTRAFVRLLFELDVTGKTQEEAQQYLRKFMEQLQTRTSAAGIIEGKPLSVAKDIALGNTYKNLNGQWAPSLNKVSVLDTSNSGFWNISAIEYWRNKFISATGVPKAHLGIEQDVNARSTLQWQDERFARTVRRIQSMLSEFLSHLIRLELLLSGVDPRRVEYKIDWAPPSTLDLLEKAQALQAIGMAAKPLLEWGVVDQDWLRVNALRMTPTQAQALAGLRPEQPEQDDG